MPGINILNIFMIAPPMGANQIVAMPQRGYRFVNMNIASDSATWWLPFEAVVADLRPALNDSMMILQRRSAYGTC